MTSIKSAALALGGDAYGRNRISCPGPGHGRHDRSLSIIFTDNGFVCESFAGDDWKECRDHIKAVLGLSDERPKPISEPATDYSVLVDQERRVDIAASIWAETVPLPGTLAERYLASRGIAYGGEALRYHPAKRMMVAMMTDALTGEPCGIHRTFLDGHGRKVDRKMLGRAAGAVVRLADDADVTDGLGIAEGIETALRAPFWPMWACLSAGTMKSLPVLEGITSLSIFADQDRAGLAAANECGQRWHSAGVEVTMAAPLKGDFADLREAA
ncbi:virulence-associated protein E [Mesorhizobium sp. B2-3-10]|nr:virulence-associated protein E [Mesorhizobium sp. B2-3-10]